MRVEALLFWLIIPSSSVLFVLVCKYRCFDVSFIVIREQSLIQVYILKCKHSQPCSIADAIE